MGEGGGLYLEVRFNGGSFALPLRGVIMEGLIFRILRYYKTSLF